MYALLCPVRERMDRHFADVNSLGAAQSLAVHHAFPHAAYVWNPQDYPVSGIPAYDRRWRRRASQNQHLAVRLIAAPWRKPPSTSPPRGAVSANSCILFRCTWHIDREPGLVVEKDRSRAREIRSCSAKNRHSPSRATTRLQSLQIDPARATEAVYVRRVHENINQLSERAHIAD